MIVNRTGAGFHRDTRREVRMPRKAEREWAIAEQVDFCSHPGDCETRHPVKPEPEKMESQISERSD